MVAMTSADFKGHSDEDGILRLDFLRERRLVEKTLDHVCLRGIDNLAGGDPVLMASMLGKPGMD